MSALPVLLRWLFRAAGLLLAGLSWLALMGMADALPERETLESLTVVPSSGDPVLIGQRELLQPEGGATALHHLAIARDAEGIVAYDISPERRVGFYATDGGYDETSRMPIPEGASTLVLGQRQATLSIERRGDQIVVTGSPDFTRLELSPTQMRVQSARIDETRAIAFFDAMTGRIRGGLTRSYAIGGSRGASHLVAALDQGTLPDRRLPEAAARLIYRNGEWALARGARVAEVRTAAGATDAEARPIRLFDAGGQQLVDRLILGRTNYRLSLNPARDALVLTPSARRTWVAPGLPGGPGMDSTGSVHPLSAGHLMRGLVIMAGIAAAVAVLALLLGARGTVPMAISGGSAFVVLAVALFRASDPVALAIYGLAGGVMTLGFDRTVFGGGRRGAWLGTVFGVVLLGIAAFLLAFMLLAPVQTVVGQFANLSALGHGAQATPLPGTRLGPALAAAWVALAMPFLIRDASPLGLLFWAVFVPVACFAALAGARLTLLEPTERYMQLFERHLLSLAMIGATATLVTSVAARGGWARGRQLLLPMSANLWRRAGLMVLGLGFAALTLFGTETGFLGLFQPSEISKSLLCIMVAMTLSRDVARRMMLPANEGSSSLMSPLLALVLTIAILVASLANYDMSPILVSGFAIVVALFAGTALHWLVLRDYRSRRRYKGLPIVQPPPPRDTLSSATLKRRLQRQLHQWSRLWPLGMAALVATVLSGFILWVYRHPSFRENAAFELPGFLMTPWKRVQSMWDMALSGSTMIEFPETGYQLRLGREAILAAPCPSTRPLCPAGAPQAPLPSGDAILLDVAAIQDDFAAVSLIHALGIDGALFYAMAQAALVAIGLGIGGLALWSRDTYRMGAWLLGLAAVGLSATVAAQIVLAWGNVLGLLPIMGQPMTFVSFGASHHIGVALPFAVVLMMAASTLDGAARPREQTRAMLFKRRLAQ